MSEMQIESDAVDEKDEFEEHAREYQETEAGEPEPAPEPEPEPEPAAAEEGEPEPAEPPQEQKPPESVPLGTFLEEKRARKETQTELQSLKEELKQLREQLQPKEPEPDPEDDPFGYLSKGQKSLEEKIEQIGSKFEETTQQTQASQIQQRVVEMENQFAEKTPDYFDAAEHIKNRRLEDYQMMGLDEDTAWQALNQEAATIVGNALKQGKNPAEVIYEFARRYGYAPKEAEQPAEQQKPNGKAEKSLKDLSRRQTQAQTLSGVNGEGGKDDLSLEDINNMSDDEFDKMFLGHQGDKNLKQMMQ